MRVVPSDLLPVANNRPSELKATLFTTFSVCIRATSLPVATSQTRAVLSQLPLASHRPSGLKATAFTSASCPMMATGRASRANPRRRAWSPSTGETPSRAEKRRRDSMPSSTWSNGLPAICACPAISRARTAWRWDSASAWDATAMFR